MRIWISLAIVACTPSATDDSATEERLGICSTDCPEGTAVAAYSSEDLVQTDAFYILEAECESLCEPIAPCAWPNVPTVVMENGEPTYVCGPLEGFSDIPYEADVDFGFAGNENLAPPLSISTGIGLPMTWAGAADVDGDGILDVVSVRGPDAVVGRGDGAGGFSLVLSALGEDAIEAGLGDFDEDGRADLAVLLLGLDGVHRLSVASGQADGRLVQGAVLADLGSQAHGPAVGDADGDGHLDLVVQGNGPTAGVTLFWGDGTGGFTPQSLPAACDVWSCVGAVGFADIDGNGTIDVWSEDAWWAQNAPRILGEQAAPTLQAGPIVGGPSVAIIDVDGDGRADFVDGGWAYTEEAMVGLHTGDGTGSFDFLGAAIADCSPPLLVAWGNLDGDGTPDAVASNETCTEAVRLMPSGPSTVAVRVDAGGFPVMADFLGQGTDQVLLVAP